MEGDLIRINKKLLPLSWLYGFGVGIRNFLFDINVLKSRTYEIPIINIGNITVGGTGKTPHTEYLLRLFLKDYKVAVLSRGYKRKSSGYLLATPDTPMKYIGDEPWQMKQKFPQAYVAVDKNRRNGIHHLCNDAETKDVDIILLDDAYQHRWVRPTTNILLIDYHRMVTDDKLLPAGRLREGVSAIHRANIVIVTKCPHDIKPMDFRVVQKALALRPYQELYFSTFKYGHLTPLMEGEKRTLDSLRNNEHILLLTGIASPEQMMIDIKQHTNHITPLSFPDHHYFSKRDVNRIEQMLETLPAPRIIVTTEKDAARLRQNENLSDNLKRLIYILPIEVEIMRNEQEIFNKKIKAHVLKDSRNSILAEGKNG